MTQQAVLVKRARIYLEELKAPARPVPADAHDVQAVRWKMREQLEQAAFTAFRTALEDGGYEGEHVGLEGIEYLAVSSHNERFTGDGLNMNRFERYLYKRKADKEKTPRMVEAALQKLIDAGGADTLLAAFQSPDIAVREWALQNVGTVLVRQGIVTDADPIIRAVRSGDAAVRQVLMTLIGESGDPHSGRLIVNALANAFATRDRKAADKATKALRSLGAEEPQLLIDGLTHDVAEVRWAIARLLGDVGTHEAIPALTEALNDPDEGVREAASVALERIESPSS